MRKVSEGTTQPQPPSKGRMEAHRSRSSTMDIQNDTSSSP